jgi:hypothetical protein
MLNSDDRERYVTTRSEWSNSLFGHHELLTHYSQRPRPLSSPVAPILSMVLYTTATASNYRTNLTPSRDR